MTIESLVHQDLADEAAVLLEQEMLAHRERARDLLAVFARALLVSAARDGAAEHRIVAAAGLPFLDGGAALLKKLAEDTDPVVRGAAQKATGKRAPSLGGEATAELIERLLSPITVADRIAAAALFFAAGLHTS